MIACAFLGANVVGSDVDGDCLGKAPSDIPLKVCQPFCLFGSQSVCLSVIEIEGLSVGQCVR